MKVQYVKLHRSTLFSMYLYFGLFFPNFYGFLGTLGAILINLSLIIFPVLYLILTRRVKLKFLSESHTAFRNYFKIPIYFILAIPISMVIGIYFLDNNLIIRDFFELHRPFYFIIIFTTSYFFFSKNFYGPSINRNILCIFILLATMGLFQFFNFSFAFYDLYIKEENFFSRRITAPFPNPYDYGFVMIFMSLYFMCMYLNNGKTIYLIFVIFSAILIAFTQSRSMLFSFVLTNIIILPFFASFVFGSLVRGKFSQIDLRIALIPLMMLFFGFISILTFQDNFTYLVRGIIKIIANPMYNGVTSNRIDQLAYILFEISKNPILTLFGNGPAKGEMDDVESIYSYFLFRYGLIGLLIGFLFPALYSSYCSQVVAKTYVHGSYEYILFRSLQLWFLVVPLISLGNNHTEQIRVSFLYILLLGLVAARVDALRRTQ